MTKEQVEREIFERIFMLILRTKNAPDAEKEAEQITTTIMSYIKEIKE